MNYQHFTLELPLVLWFVKWLKSSDISRTVLALLLLSFPDDLFNIPRTWEMLTPSLPSHTPNQYGSPLHPPSHLHPIKGTELRYFCPVSNFNLNYKENLYKLKKKSFPDLPASGKHDLTAIPTPCLKFSTPIESWY